MKAITWLASFSVGVAALTAPAFAAETEGWSSNLDEALAQAKKSNKPLLVEFTGSDWCPPCIQMRKKVFSTKEFIEAASKDYILVEIDMPRGNQELRTKNEPIVERYKIEGFPTVLLLKPDGTEASRFFASLYSDTPSFLKHLQEQLPKTK